MKRRFNKLSIVTVVSIFALSVLISISLMAAQNVKEATIKQLDGMVDVKKAGTENWVPAAAGMKLTSGDSIRTTLDSIVDLVFEDGSVIRLTEETNLLIDDLSQNVEKGRFLYFFDRNVEAKKTKFKLSEGKIIASVRELPNSKSQFTVETPKGIAGVRGTNWEIGENEIGVVQGYIKWLPKSKMHADGGSNPLDVFRNALSGGRSDEFLTARTVLPGQIVGIDPDGNPRNEGILPRAQLIEINNAVTQIVGTTVPPAPGSQAAILNPNQQDSSTDDDLDKGKEGLKQNIGPDGKLNEGQNNNEGFIKNELRGDTGATTTGNPAGGESTSSDTFM